MTKPEDLALRDIHLPADPSWWPPAPGWWILLGLLIVLILLIYSLYRRRQRHRLSAVNLARQSLTALRSRYAGETDTKAMVAELSVLLRRLSISAFPREDAAGLTGEDWLQFLDKPMPEQPFSQGAGHILIDAPYRRQVQEEELDTLFELCESWIDAVSKRGAGV